MAAAAPHTIAWHALAPDDAAARLGADADAGLSSAEAAQRLAVQGPNTLPEAPRRTILNAFAEQFANFLILLLVAATVIAAAIGEYLDAVTIAAIVGVSAAIGVAQEWRAGRALEALRAMMVPVARAVRDGRVVDLPAAELVPGDRVLLDAGANVPADLRLVEAASLSLNEATLTGESSPVAKDPDAMLEAGTPVTDRTTCAFAGTVVNYGRGAGLVVATGTGTEIGRIATMIGAIDQETTPLQRRMSTLGRWLGSAAIAISAVLFAVGAATGAGVLDMLLTSVSLAVAAVPEGLPAVVAISLALGMQRMARRHALMRRLSAVETLGAATVIASDKTGTLTKGEMTVVQVYLGPDVPGVDVSGTGFEPAGELLRDGRPVRPDAQLRLLLQASALCNDAYLQQDGERWSVAGDATEGALAVLAAKAGLSARDLARSYPRVDEVPFSAERRRMTTVHRDPKGGLVAFHKGAARDVLERCSQRQRGDEAVALTPEQRDEILGANRELASRGLRLLALAYRPLAAPPDGEIERDFIFLGLAAIQDPPRPEARPAVATCRRAGIVPIMITGDHAATALAIARQLEIAGPDDAAVTGADLDAMDGPALREAVATTRVYARISPEQKVRIVEVLRDEGHIVAVTGDGVNDAPALKRAHIGAAMGITGTDVAKEAADMVITDDNFASVVAAVEEGRKIFDNIRNFVVYLLSANIGEIILVGGGVVAGLPIPLLAMQILWVNLVTDSLPALALSLERGDPDVMLRRPRPPDEPIITRPVAGVLALRGAVEGFGALAVFVVWLYAFDASDDAARTVAFATIVVAELLEAHGSRSLYRTIWELGPLSNPYVVGATLLSFGALLGVLYLPPFQEAFHTEALGAGGWLAVLIVAGLRLAMIEGLKVSPWRLPLERPGPG